MLRQTGRIDGDLFIDCSGLHGLLIDKHYRVDWLSQQDVLFNNCALAVQMPYQDDQQPIPSCTRSTAVEHGWIWDIALQNRRGTGIVYSDQYVDDDVAQESLKHYLSGTNTAEQIAQASFRKIQFSPGYRQTFWQNNCVAVGMSAGFIEPLEASAIVMVELSAQYICEQMPLSKPSMRAAASRFNDLFGYRWQQIINFLKLHYVLSERNGPYWQAHKAPASMPMSLIELLDLWSVNPPKHTDLWHNDEIFSAASYQYVMLVIQQQQWLTRGEQFMHMSSSEFQAHSTQRQQLDAQITQLLEHLPNNNELLASYHQR